MMRTISKIENEIKNLEYVKVENIEVFTNTYIGENGIIPSLYREICVVEKRNISDCLQKLIELRQRFNKILRDNSSI